MKQSMYYTLPDNACLYYERSGNPEGFPLLLLHGGLGNLTHLYAIHQYIPSQYQLISLDLRGHGKSTLGIKPLTYAQYQQDISALLEHLKIKQFAILGFSDGGIVAYRLAAAYPDRVTQLTTLGAQWKLDPDGEIARMFKDLSAEFWQKEFKQDVDYYLAQNPAPDFPILFEQVKNLWLDQSSSGYPQEMIADITCPTLIARGEDDFLFSLQEAIEMVEKIPHAHFFNIPFAQHEAHIEFTALFGIAINRFLTEQSNAH
ncbi:MAG TPA: oxidoreductase [Pasteurellaceae bacterium]|nr:oxidoreductase [Pasteurellaceae bacterium]